VSDGAPRGDGPPITADADAGADVVTDALPDGPVDAAAGDANPFSPAVLPRRSVMFQVRLPEMLPVDTPVFLRVMPFEDWVSDQQVRLTRAADGTASGAAMLEVGSLTRYVYDRFDNATGVLSKATRESVGNIAIEHRYVLVTGDLERVDDIIDAFADLPRSGPVGALEGQITGSGGKPLVDAEVSVAGLHTSTDFAGRFRLATVPAGKQRVTAYTTLGDHQATVADVTVTAGGRATTSLMLMAAARAPTTFEITLPPATPAGDIRLVGSVFALGARPLGRYPNATEPMHAPVLERQGLTARVTLDLHEGTYVQYFYTLGAREQSLDPGRGEPYRSFVVRTASSVRRDRIESWRFAGGVEVILRATVPPTTTAAAPIAFQTGPMVWMSAGPPGEWFIRLVGLPGETLRYRLLHGGDDRIGYESSPDAENQGFRTLVFPATDSDARVTVTRWATARDAQNAAAGSPVKVTFRVTLPSDTPADAAIRVLGSGALAGGVPLARRPGDPLLAIGSTTLAAGDEIRYSFDRGVAGTEATAGQLSARVTHEGQLLDHWVTAWSDRVSTRPASRAGAITGAYPPDFWSPPFLALSAPYFAHLKRKNIEWVALSSVWAFGTLDPPTLEPRMIHSSPVLTPRGDLVRQIGVARESGMKVLLAPQSAPDVIDNWRDTLGPAMTSPGWWRAYLDEAERLWMWNALVAAEGQAEALLLPGPVFHVFPTADVIPPVFLPELEERVSGMIAAVRAVYGGQILMNASRRNYEFLKKIDLAGVTTFDLGDPGLPATASVAEWRAAFDAAMAASVDSMYARYGLPAIFYGFHVNSPPGDAQDPGGEEAQARRLEGLLQAAMARPFFRGAFSWANIMIDAPLTPETEGVRGRLGEAVLAKHYGILSGQP
jgi:hypothetical protein